MRALTVAVTLAWLAGLFSVQVAALVIAVLSLAMSTYAVVVARASRLDRLAELERQTEAVAAMAELRDEVEAQLRTTDEA